MCNSPIHASIFSRSGKLTHLLPFPLHTHTSTITNTPQASKPHISPNIHRLTLAQHLSHLSLNISLFYRTRTSHHITSHTRTAPHLRTPTPNTKMDNPYAHNATSLGTLATVGTPAERAFRGFLCGTILGVALALMCGCFVPCVSRG